MIKLNGEYISKSEMHLKGNLLVMVSFDRHPHKNTIVGRLLKIDFNRNAAGTQLIQTDVLCLPILSTLQQWLRVRFSVRCILAREILTL
jgi:hypothetical protein